MMTISATFARPFAQPIRSSHPTEEEPLPIATVTGTASESDSMWLYLWIALLSVFLASCSRQQPTAVLAQVVQDEKINGTSIAGNGLKAFQKKRDERTHVVVLKHAFGCLEPGTISTCELALRNDGDSALTFDSAKPSCGCVFSKNMPSSIAPGKAGTFVVALDTTGKRGITKERVVFSGKSDSAFVVVAEVRALVKGLWTDPAILDLGNLAIGVPAEADIVVVGAGYSNAKVVSVHAADDWLKVTRRDVTTATKMLAQDERALAALRIQWTGGSIPPGRVASQLSIATDIEAYRMLHIPVIGHVLGAIAVVPSPIVFGHVGPNKLVTRTCRLSFGSSSGELSDLECMSDHECVHAVVGRSDFQSQSECVLTVTLKTPTAREAKLIQGSIRGRTKSTGITIFSVPYIGHLGGP